MCLFLKIYGQCMEYNCRIYILRRIKKHCFIHFLCLFLKLMKDFTVSLNELSVMRRHKWQLMDSTQRWSASKCNWKSLQSTVQILLRNLWWTYHKTQPVLQCLSLFLVYINNYKHNNIVTFTCFHLSYKHSVHKASMKELNIRFI